MVAGLAPNVELQGKVAPYPKLAALLGHWERLRGGRPMPHPRDFDILDIRTLAGDLHLIDVRREGRRIRFHFRVYASNIAQAGGADYHRRYVDDVALDGWRVAVSDAFQRVVDHQRPEYSETGEIFDTRIVLGFRHLACPLSSDGRTVDRLLCAAVPLHSDPARLPLPALHGPRFRPRAAGAAYPAVATEPAMRDAGGRSRP